MLHGWFTEPEPFFDGGLSGEAVSHASAMCTDHIPMATTRAMFAAFAHLRARSPAARFATLPSK